MRTDRVLNTEVFRWGWHFPVAPKPARSKWTAAVRQVVRDDRIRLREQVILERLPLVKEISASIHKDVSDISMEEIVRAGISGLARAVHGFDPQRDGSFSSYAKDRIKTAIFDRVAELERAHPSKLRKTDRAEDATLGDWTFRGEELGAVLPLVIDKLPRAHRRAARLYYEQELTDREVASALGTSVREASRLRNSIIEAIAFRLASMHRGSK